MELFSNSLRAAWDSQYICPQRNDSLCGGWCTEGCYIHKKSKKHYRAEPAHTPAFPIKMQPAWQATLRMEVARKQDRAPVPETPQALSWGSNSGAEEKERTGLRLPNPERCLAGGGGQERKGSCVAWEKWQTLEGVWGGQKVNHFLCIF